MWQLEKKIEGAFNREEFSSERSEVARHQLWKGHERDVLGKETLILVLPVMLKDTGNKILIYGRRLFHEWRGESCRSLYLRESQVIWQGDLGVGDKRRWNQGMRLSTNGALDPAATQRRELDSRFDFSSIIMHMDKTT